MCSEGAEGDVLERVDTLIYENYAITVNTQ